MMTAADPCPILTRLDPAELARLMQMPINALEQEPTRSLLNEARRHFSDIAAIWSTRTSPVAVSRLEEEVIELEDGSVLNSRLLARRIAKARAEAVIAFAVTAGAQVSQATGALWADDPHRAYMLDVLATAVVEHLVRDGREALVLRYAGHGLQPAFSLSPGHVGWTLEDQSTVYKLLRARCDERDWPLALHESGCLEPVKSQIGIFALTAAPVSGDAAEVCRACALANCSFRRAEYAGL